MGGKVFLNRNSKKGSSSHYYKYFLWAAIGLVLLVVITPLITQRRSDKTVSKKVTAENGMVVREIPRSSPLDMGSGLASRQPDSAEGISESSLEPGLTESEHTPRVEEGSGASGYTESPVGESAVPPGGTPDERPRLASMAESQPEALALEKDAAGSPSPTEVKPVEATPTVQPDPAPAKSAVSRQQPPPAHPRQASVAPSAPVSKSAAKAASPTGTRYVVQIGSFKQRQNADNIQQTLLQKGYEVIVRTTTHPNFGRLYVVQLAPVSDQRKAESLMTNVRKETSVKPMLLKVSSGQ